MKIYKKTALLVVIIFTIIITCNYIYLKISVSYFDLKPFQLNNLLAIDIVAGGSILVLLKKGMQIFIYNTNLDNEFKNSNKKAENTYERLLDCLDVGYVYYRIVKDEFGNDINAKVIEVNESSANILGETRENILDCPFNIFIDKYVKGKYEHLKIIESLRNDGKFKLTEYINISKDKWIGFSIYRIKGDDFAIIITDVSERKKFIDEMKYLANYDSLTNLKNRYSLYNCMADLHRKKKEFAIFFIDLDNFKILNDSLGHDLGDKVIHKVALILKRYESDLINIGRIGGDEFLIILEDNTSIENIKKFGQTVLESLNFSFDYNSYSYDIKASIGVSVFKRDTDNIVTLIKYADIAMYHSKEKGGNEVSIFRGEMLENEIKKMG